jgi:hypothetical protein
MFGDRLWPEQPPAMPQGIAGSRGPEFEALHSFHPGEKQLLM